MDYSKLDLSALRAYARKQGVRVTTGMSRDQLLRAVKNKSVSDATSKTTNKKTGPSPASIAKKNMEDAIMGVVKDTPAYKAHFGNNKKKDLSNVRGLGKIALENAEKLKDASGTSTKLKDKSVSSTTLKPVSKVPTPRKRPAGSNTSTTTKATPAKTSGSTLKNNLSMAKDKMATSISAARKRGEGYYFDNKSGKKQLAIYKNDLKQGESLRSAANRLLGLTKGK